MEAGEETRLALTVLRARIQEVEAAEELLVSWAHYHGGMRCELLALLLTH